MRNFLRVSSVLFLVLAFSSLTFAGDKILGIDKVKELKYGTKIYGYSTLSPEERTRFEGRFWGVLENSIGPGHRWIVVELDGKYFQNSGIIAGQSGSPVYIQVNGAEYQIGTVSYADRFPKNPIAYLTPIEEVLNSSCELPRALPEDNVIEEILKWFKESDEKDKLEKFSGLIARQSFTSGKSTTEPKLVSNESKEIKSGSVLGVQLAWGDFDYTGYGTVSYVDGKNIYMFGHPFLQLGPVEYRLVPARVLGVQASYSSSYIVAAPVAGAKPVGVISQDRETGIYGVLGDEPKSSIPVKVNLTTSNGVKKEFNFNTVSDSNIGPILVGMGAFASVSSWSRAMGNTTLFLNGIIQVDDRTIEFNEAFYSSETSRGNVMGNVFNTVARKVDSLLENEYLKPHITQITLNVKVFDEVRALKIENVVLDSPVLRPGKEVHLKISLNQPRQEPKIVVLPLAIPSDLGDGVGRIVIGDASAIEKIENQNSKVVNIATLIKSLDNKRKADAVYIYVVYPPSPIEPPKDSGDEKSGPISVKKTSKRLFSNVEEYEIRIEDFMVHGKVVIEFKIGSVNGSGNGHGQEAKK